ncbi:MAG: hypothetical protein KGH93_00920 [Patescibacteria group bacterium]|nr:hypothetical protein [Patescibacteria group bacterium]MDE1945742.1 hypothetical protein [Patescibacteria group bacterium]
MDNFLPDELKQQYAALPRELQAAIAAADLPDKLQTIAMDNKLLLDQAGGVQMETLLVLFGLESLDDYIDNLVKNAGLSRGQAIACAKEADDLIFKNIRETLQKLDEAEKTAEDEENKKTVMPSREEILAGIENPKSIGAAPVAAAPAASPATAPMQPAGKSAEENLLPEIPPAPGMPAVTAFAPEEKPYHANISPAADIVAAKMSAPVIVPAQTVVVEEKSKLPEAKPASSAAGADPYREAIS